MDILPVSVIICTKNAEGIIEAWGMVKGFFKLIKETIRGGQGHPKEE